MIPPSLRIAALENEIAELGKRLRDVAERVRLHGVAERFLTNAAEIRKGDYFLLRGEHPTKLSSVSSDGRWTYNDGRGTIEPFENPTDVTRLYTPAEVAEILAATTAVSDDVIRRLREAYEDATRRLDALEHT